MGASRAREEKEKIDAYRPVQGERRVRPLALSYPLIAATSRSQFSETSLSLSLTSFVPSRRVRPLRRGRRVRTTHAARDNTRRNNRRDVNFRPPLAQRKNKHAPNPNDSPGSPRRRRRRRTNGGGARHVIPRAMPTIHTHTRVPALRTHTCTLTYAQ